MRLEDVSGYSTVREESESRRASAWIKKLVRHACGDSASEKLISRMEETAPCTRDVRVDTDDDAVRDMYAGRRAAAGRPVGAANINGLIPSRSDDLHLSDLR